MRLADPTRPSLEVRCPIISNEFDLRRLIQLLWPSILSCREVTEIVRAHHVSCFDIPHTVLCPDVDAKLPVRPTLPPVSWVHAIWFCRGVRPNGAALGVDRHRSHTLRTECT